MKHTDYPAIYQSASSLSESAQNAFYLAFLSHMSLLACASAISVWNSPSAEIAIVQALVLIGALGCAVYLYFGRPDRHWYSGRAVAESIKTSTWRYVSKAEPFDNSDVVDANKLRLRIKTIIEQNKDVAGLLTTHLDGVQVSDEMNRLRQGSAADRLEYYRNNRIIEQQSWYAKKASFNRKMVKRFFIFLVIVIGIAIALSVAKVRFPTASYWPTDFFVTAAAGILSWIQAKRFQELAVSYALTAHEIGFIKQEAVGPMASDELSKFVGDAENAFSREHTQWIARKDH
jgi:SMODS and SLOG-associating 2TM effector domain 1/SMODS and SLOG-associating 2TM effector domain 3